VTKTAKSGPVRWGILGTAQIARKNWKAILNTGNAVVIAVASRDADRARRFISECQAKAEFGAEPVALGSYQELLASPEIDAVYIPLPTGLRKEWVLRAAQAGKHVLCEKPCGCSANDVSEMIAMCRCNRVQFMDGVMFMHSRRLQRMRAVLDDGASIGGVKRVTSSFGAYVPEESLRANIRGQGALEPFGCLGDLGWYCIRFSLWAMNWRLPYQVTGHILSQLPGTGGAAAVPTQFSAELVFEDGASASFYCSFVTGHEQWANVCGTQGCLYVPDFVLPFHGAEVAFETHQATFELQGCDFEMKPLRRRIVVNEHSNSHPTAQESNMFRAFSDRVRSGRLDASWPDMALRTQQVMDSCLGAARAGRPVTLAMRITE
jgi:predicted dehydrogenase